MAPDAFEGRIVVIGATVAGCGDVFPTPFDPIMPGVEVISTAIAQLLDGGEIVRDRMARLVDAGVATILPMVLVALLAWRRSAVGLLAMLGVVLAWLVLNSAAFFHGIWLSIALPAGRRTASACPFRGGPDLARSTSGVPRRRAEPPAAKVQGALEKWLAQDETFLAEPLHQDAAMVFIDISGFTGLSGRGDERSAQRLCALVDEEAGGIAVSSPDPPAMGP